MADNEQTSDAVSRIRNLARSAAFPMIAALTSIAVTVLPLTLFFGDGRHVACVTGTQGAVVGDTEKDVAQIGGRLLAKARFKTGLGGAPGRYGPRRAPSAHISGQRPTAAERGASPYRAATSLLSAGPASCRHADRSPASGAADQRRSVRRPHPPGNHAARPK